MTHDRWPKTFCKSYLLPKFSPRISQPFHKAAQFFPQTFRSFPQDSTVGSHLPVRLGITWGYTPTPAIGGKIIKKRNKKQAENLIVSLEFCFKKASCNISQHWQPHPLLDDNDAADLFGDRGIGTKGQRNYEFQNSVGAGLADESEVETEQSLTKPAPTTHNW